MDMDQHDERFCIPYDPALAEVAGFERRRLAVRLARPRETSMGRASVLDFVDDQTRNVEVELGPGDYDRAIQAHQERIPVSCRGDLVKEGQTYRLRNPHHLALLPEEVAT